eukprot:CAMPEP_0183706200 /NCGR_PEP_ID=MMETSP0737-20130205/3095_1 /TAXON_ID=385413 /ORGANISM="Thalassiosira miniscula, Strain CCMP1093" /LENGTH=518 /DNA_ID=CAMNT_0025933551 /DNA_START=69 /DNA_END=1625 /DNA_ORIENTATION=+
MYPSSILSPLLFVLLSGSSVDAFAPPQSRSAAAYRQLRQRSHLVPLQSRNQDDGDDSDSIEQPQPHPPSALPSRRDALRQSAASLIAGAGFVANPSTSSALPAIASFSNPLAPSANSSNGGYYVPAKRCTAYLVDSTIPPSLIPYRASREAAILKNLGMGSGTPKSAFVEEDINLNNFMNKAVFGSIDAVQKVTGQAESGPGKSGPNYQSYVFLGANFDDTYTASPEKMGGETNSDASLAVGLLTDICKPKERNGNTAIGLAFVPQSGQSALNEYLSTSNSGSEDEAESALVQSLKSTGADEGLAQRHLPILRFAKKKRFALLALAPEPADLATVQKGGLQSLEPSRRDAYVADAQGFIALTQDPKFKLYADKSLLKDAPITSTDEAAIKAEQANFFAERILVHEACATAMAKWATSRPDSLVVTIAAIPDVRFLGGINGRIPRISKSLNADTLVDEETVTTILLNPSARETLSESKFLRLEIGTAPNNWTYQTKVADYLWFSSMPKVNMLPRMMNEQ